MIRFSDTSALNSQTYFFFVNLLIPDSYSHAHISNINNRQGIEAKCPLTEKLIENVIHI